MSSEAIYPSSKGVMEKISDVMSVQLTPTFKLALMWQHTFYDNLKAGNIPAFTTENQLCLPVFSRKQIVAAPMEQQPDTSAQHDHCSVRVPEAPADGGEDSVSNDDDMIGDVEEDALVPPPHPATSMTRKKHSQPTPETTATPVISTTQEAAYVLASPPDITGLAHKKQWTLTRAKRLEAARHIARKLRNRKTHRRVTLDDAETILEGFNSFDSTSQLVRALQLPVTEVRKPLQIRHFTVRQKTPVIDRSPALDKKPFTRSIWRGRSTLCSHTGKAEKVKLFDPQQSASNYAFLESSLSADIEPQLELQDQLSYEKIDWCEQQDGNPCGIWCNVLSELLLTESKWGDALYELLPYL
ncbi:hypothetical protein PF001_g2335 [Phytophthora fragariae]|uniref:Ubiquitin-like protease family profile domain-containing protein n=1 Tax=Phytophthora fragariae TaxID=53985 RepID=A0A6A4ESQ9_9STRA|nr:hypothetical protein PF001_g2335 [Phytophthora fragariae]